MLPCDFLQNLWAKSIFFLFLFGGALTHNCLKAQDMKIFTVWVEPVGTSCSHSVSARSGRWGEIQAQILKTETQSKVVTLPLTVGQMMDQRAK